MNDDGRANRITLFKPGRLKVEFDYRPNLVDLMKAVGGRFHNNKTEKFWTIPLDALEKVRSAAPGTFAIDYLAHKAWLDLSDEIRRQDVRRNQIAADWKASHTAGHVWPDGHVNYPFQHDGIVRLIETSRLILADDVGLGKTRQSLIAAAAYRVPILVVCPTSLKDQWQRAADRLGIEIASITSWHHDKIPAPPDFRYGVIFDEAHYMGTATAKRTKSALALALAPLNQFTFLLTATPMRNGQPRYMFPLLVAARRYRESDQRDFEIRFCGGRKVYFPKRGREVWMTERATNLPKLRAETNSVLLRRTKDRLDLPPLIRAIYEATPDDESKAVFDARFDDLMATWRERVDAGIVSSESEALVEIGYLRMANSVAKVNTTAEIAAQAIDNGAQILIFVAYKTVIEDLRREITAASGIADDLVIESLTGDTPQKSRDARVQSFQDGKIHGLIMTYGAGGVGLNMQAASTVILHDRPWTPDEVTQAVGRAHRDGQTGTVTEIWIQHGGVDVEIDKIVDTKQDAIDLLIEGKPIRSARPGTIARHVIDKLLTKGKAT